MGIKVVRILFLSSVMGVAASTQAWAQCAAYGANPNDWVPDDVALNECFANNANVYLDPGNPGYIVNSGLLFRSNQTLLTSSTQDKATLIAGADLFAPMLNVVSSSPGYEISELRFDGRKDIRTRTDQCAINNGGLNLYIQGSSFKLHHLDVVNAMCLAGAFVRGDNFEIYSVFAAYNGYAPNEAYGRWANGFHVIRCTGGYIHNNWFIENTDVGLAIVTGNNCQVLWNEVTNQQRQAFAGLHVGDTTEGSDLAGSVVAYNTITSGVDLLPFGLVVGPHAWNSGSFTYGDVGQVINNSISGAVVNLAIDGISAGTIGNNSTSNNQGSRSFNCGSYSAAVTASDWGSASIQQGYVCKRFHSNDCSAVCQ